MKTSSNFILPYVNKTKSRQLALSVNQYGIKYHMGWLGIFGSDEDKTDNQEDKSGISIDWDAYDSINTPDKGHEDRGVIEVPANAETVIYESPDGSTYEIPISDLIDADDDHEIEYKSKEIRKHYNHTCNTKLYHKKNTRGQHIIFTQPAKIMSAQQRLHIH